MLDVYRRFQLGRNALWGGGRSWGEKMIGQLLKRFIGVWRGSSVRGKKNGKRGKKGDLCSSGYLKGGKECLLSW